MLVLFKALSLYLFFLKHIIGAVHQKLSYEGSFLRENALIWFSSSILTTYFLSAFSIRIFSMIYLLIYLFILIVYVDFKTFISIIYFLNIRVCLH